MINLVIRRTIAFAIDFALLAILVAVPGLICLIEQKDMPATFNLFLLVVILLYFSYFETFKSGQTYGKRLLRIRLQTESGGNVSLYQSCARICLILLLPEFSTLIENFLVAIYSPMSSGFVLPIFLHASSLAVWPISIVIGSGRLGLHDFILDTEVVYVSKQHQLFNVKTVRGYPWIVIMGTIAISLVCVYFLIQPMETTFRDKLNRTNRSEKLEFERLRNIASDLPLKIANGPKYISGDGQIAFNNWDLLKLPDTSIDFSSALSSGEISIDNHKINTYVYYKVYLTPKGIWSFNVQNAIVEYIFSRAKRPGLLISIEFFQDTTALIFYQTIKKRYIGYIPLEDGSEEKKNTLITFEPEAVSKSFGISWSLLIREDL
jgi:uncharacterized RDD family membrane protein YckC